MARGLKGIKKPHPLGSVPTRSSASTGVKISELPAADAANDTDQLEVNQGGVSRRISAGQIAVLASGAIDLASLGIVSDGVDKTALLNAIFATYGGSAYYLRKLGSGNVLTTGNVSMPNGGRLVMADDVVWEAAHISWLGSLGAETPLTTAAARGASSFACNTTGLAVDDWILVKGCTNIGSIDGGVDQLNYDGLGLGLFAGEWFRVTSVAVGSAGVAGGTRWPYAITPGANSHARTVSTVAKASFTTGSISGGTIKTRETGAFNEVVRITNGYNVVLDDITFLDQTDDSPGIVTVVIETSLNCTVRNCTVERPVWNGSGSPSLRNVIEVLSSTGIVVRDNYFNGGVAAVDFDLLNSGIPCAGGVFSGNRVMNATVGALTHEGNIQCTFNDNVIINCDTGMQMRSPLSLMANNSVFSGKRTAGVGLFIRQAWVDQTVCTGNIVQGFLQGIQVSFVPLNGPQVQPARVVLRDNIVKYAVTGIQIINTGQQNALTRSVAVLGGIIVSEPTVTQAHVAMDSYIEITVDRVRFVGGVRFSTPLGAIAIPVNVAVVNIGQNSFEDLGATVNGVYGPGAAALTDVAVWPTGDAAAKWTIGRQLMLGTSAAGTANMPSIAFGSAVAQLPAAATYPGVTFYVTDATGPVVGAVVVGGGAAKVQVASNATAWKVTAVL